MYSLVELGIEYLKQVQRNQFPVLFVDSILDLKPGVMAKTRKAYSYNEWFFQGHFDDEPVVPGFVLLESLTQSFLLTFLSLEENFGKKTAYISVDGATFSRKVIPGEVVEMHADLESLRFGVAIGECFGYVNGEKACWVKLKIGLPETLKKFLPS